jgi:hypothetical protein
MPKYRITIHQNNTMQCTVEVDADNRVEAKREAHNKAYENPDIWTEIDCDNEQEIVAIEEISCLPKYNHAFDIAFSIENYDKNGIASTQELLDGMQSRLNYLKAHPAEANECFGHMDSYEVPYAKV